MHRQPMLQNTAVVRRQFPGVLGMPDTTPADWHKRTATYVILFVKSYPMFHETVAADS